MQFTTGNLTACPGGEHLELPITVGSNSKILRFTREELKELVPTDIEQVRESILVRLRSAILETIVGTPTAIQIRNAISGKTFEI